MPGAVFGLLTVLLLWILRDDLVDLFTPYLAGDSGLGIVLAGLLGSGALGFFFSVVHHEMHWLTHGSPLDFTDTVRQLVRDNKIKIYEVPPPNADIKERPVPENHIGRELAWTVLIAIWHGDLANGPYNSAQPRTESLCDTAHALGAARVAAAMALIFALALAAKNSDFQPCGWPLARFCFAAIVGWSSVWVFGRAYRLTGHLAQLSIEHVFYAAVLERFEPYVVHVNPNLLKRLRRLNLTRS